MTSGQANILSALPLAALLMMGLAACQPQAVEQKQAAVLAQLSADELQARPAYYGGDTRAWPTDRGNNCDSGYCAARLKLPLATEPAWEYSYSAAEFSARPATAIVHYDGKLYLSASSSQLAVLDAASGKLLMNRDVYAHENNDSSEQIQRLYGHPQGLLLAQDNLGRYYAWDLLNPVLPRLWLGSRRDIGSGFVTDGTLMLASWTDELAAVDVLDGEQRWSYPSACDPGGLVLSHSGIEIWWSSTGRLYALHAADGAPLWNITTADMIDRVIINEHEQLAYVAYGSEYLECRSLADGTVRWQYSWVGLWSAAARERLLAEATRQVGEHTASLAWTGVENVIDNLAALPEGGLIISLADGRLIALDAAGTERWRYSGKAPAYGMLAFENGVILGSVYASPAAYPWKRAVFSLTAPDWPRLRQVQQQQGQPEPSNNTGAAQPAAPALGARTANGPPRQEMFYRLAVLDIDSGRELDSFEPELLPASSLIPAQGNIVFGEAPRYWAFTGVNQPGQRLRVLAFPWIDREGE
jgi:outer membrane protein assembly factor BamB